MVPLVHSIILTLKLLWGFVGVSRNSVPIPSVSTSALSHGAFLGVSGNVRYQLLNGAERVMQQHFNHLGVVLFCSTALRFVVTSITLIVAFIVNHEDFANVGWRVYLTI